MRKFTWLVASSMMLVLPLSVGADDSSDAKSVIDKAVTAVGGKDKAGSLGDLTLKTKARILEDARVGEGIFEMSIKDLDKARLDMTMTMNGKVEKATVVMSGDRLWAFHDGRTDPDEAPDEVKPAIQSFLLAVFAPANPLAIGKLKDVELTHGGDAKIGDAAAWVVQIGRKNRPTLSIYFDQKTGLPLKSEIMIKEPNGKEATFGFSFSDYKEKDGVKLFSKMKIERDGKLLADLEVTEFKPGAKIDASLFEKP